MVSVKTSFLILVLSSLCCAAEEFIDEKPAKKTSLSKARRESLDTLEALGHDLATEIEHASRMLQDVMWTVRDLAEGESKSAGMTALHKDRTHTIAEYKKMLQETRARVSQLEQEVRFFRKSAEMPVKTYEIVKIEKKASTHQAKDEQPKLEHLLI
jgi:predicted RNase H-like nuclease (RuvC/YqgF family)